MEEKTYREIQCSAACNRVRGRFPYHWDLNIYRGCAHQCQYCFALYSHAYMESDDFYGDIFVKTNIAEKLERQLKSRNWDHQVINLGGVTDNYQPAEAQYRIMPELLKLLIRFENPAIISTKSDLILRDYDLIDQLSRVAYVNIAATITTMDEDVRSVLEPGGVSSRRRFEVLEEFRRTNASTGVHMMPIVPYITSTRENLEAVFSETKHRDLHYLITSNLNLKGPTRAVFFRFVRNEFPQYEQKLTKLFSYGKEYKDYKKELYQIISEVRAKYQVKADFGSIIKEKNAQFQAEQLSFF
ncbi:SPL family radical SAM protein [Anaerostipes sp.]|uniref:SPL family radical SAM protein n=1 Tax=Anaerostipes sp. TaxID=1872530 RepID=UPI0025BC9985|nr:radical SAM protein [Anaerostipes sp.]MBS7008316.1 radical SAM protein [Anaerostipes sp.]